MYIPRTANAFHGASKRATDIGKIVLIVGPTFGIILRIPASKAFAITNLTPNTDKPIPASNATKNELINTPTIQLLNASPH